MKTKSHLVAAAAFAIGTFSAQAALVGEWTFDIRNDGSAYDTSVNDNVGTISGAVWKSAALCKVGTCLSFDGNDYEIYYWNGP